MGSASSASTYRVPTTLEVLYALPTDSLMSIVGEAVQAAMPCVLAAALVFMPPSAHAAEAFSRSLVHVVPPAAAECAFAVHFEAVAWALLWSLADSPLDVPANAAALGLRSFAVGLHDSRPLRVAPSVVVKTPAVRKAVLGLADLFAAATSGASVVASSGSKSNAAIVGGAVSRPWTNIDVSGHVPDFAFLGPLSSASGYLAILPDRCGGGDAECARARPFARTLIGPMEVVLQRYLLMFFSKLSSLLVARSVPTGAKARALVALQRLLVRVGGGGADSKLDKHVPTVLALLRLALTPPAQAPLRIAAAAVWLNFTQLLSDGALRQYLPILATGARFSMWG